MQCLFATEKTTVTLYHDPPKRGSHSAEKNGYPSIRTRTPYVFRVHITCCVLSSKLAKPGAFFRSWFCFIIHQLLLVP